MTKSEKTEDKEVKVVHEHDGITSKFAALIIAIIAVTALVIAVMLAVTRVPTENTQWVCTQTQCADTELAGQQWVQENCVVMENATTQMCQVTDGQGGTRMVPITQINTSAIYMCTESVCTQRVLVQNGNSTFEQHEDYYTVRNE